MAATGNLNDVVVLCSGGIDSTTLAFECNRLGRLHSLLFIDWEQPARDQERGVLRWIKQAVGRPVEELRIPMFGCDRMQLGPRKEGARVVPVRNLLFASYALNYAASMGCHEIWIGANADDAEEYADCRESFVAALSDLSRLTFGILVVAPFIEWTKRQVVEYAGEIGVNINATWSCYEPDNEEPCGRCNACVARCAAIGADTMRKPTGA